MSISIHSGSQQVSCYCLNKSKPTAHEGLAKDFLQQLHAKGSGRVRGGSGYGGSRGSIGNHYGYSYGGGSGKGSNKVRGGSGRVHHAHGSGRIRGGSGRGGSRGSIGHHYGYPYGGGSGRGSNKVRGGSGRVHHAHGSGKGGSGNFFDKVRNHHYGYRHTIGKWGW